MTKLTEYTSPAKQEAKIEAQRRNAEARVLQKHPRNWEALLSKNDLLLEMNQLDFVYEKVLY